MSALALPARLPAATRALREKLARSRRRTASLGDVVRAHWQWKHEHADDDVKREQYEATRELFEKEHGKIVDDYWSPGREVDVSSHGGQFAFFVTSAFAVGFSERFAKPIVRTAEGGTPGPATAATIAPATAAPPTAATT